MGQIPALLFWAGILMCTQGCTKTLRANKNFSDFSFFSNSGTTHSSPECQQTDTENEGWYLNGALIQRAHCAGRFAECQTQNEKKQWVSFTRSNIRLVRFENCEDKKVPLCSAAATKNEGWQASDWFQVDSCANLGIACQNVGTRSEGWYAFEKRDVQPLDNVSCKY